MDKNLPTPERATSHFISKKVENCLSFITTGTDTTTLQSCIYYSLVNLSNEKVSYVKLIKETGQRYLDTNKKTNGAFALLALSIDKLKHHKGELYIVGSITCAGALARAKKGRPVVLAANELSIRKTAELIKESYPDIDPVLFADNDQTGIRAAQNNKFKWCIPSKLNDWLDVEEAGGPEAVEQEIKKQISKPLEIFNYSQILTMPSNSKEVKWANKMAGIARHVPAKYGIEELDNPKHVEESIHPETRNNILNWLKDNYKKRVYFAKKEFSVSDKILNEHDVEHVDRSFSISQAFEQRYKYKDYHAIILMPPVGWGKTHQAEDWVKYWLESPERSGRILAIVNSILLTYQAHERFNHKGMIEHYKETDRYSGEHAQGLVTCAPSIAKKQISGIVDHANVLICDEFPQSMQIMCSKECGSGEQYNKMLELIREIGALNKVPMLFADAQFNDFWVEFIIRALIDGGVDNPKLLFLKADPVIKGRKFKWHQHKKSDYGALISEVGLCMKNDLATVIIMESANAAESLEKYFHEKYPDKKILCLTKNTKYRQSFKEFEKDPNGTTSDVDLLLYSPVLNSGISIEHVNKHFKHFIFSGNGNSIEAKTAFQMIGRVRYLKSCSIFINGTPAITHHLPKSKLCKVGAFHGLELLSKRNDNKKTSDEYSLFKHDLANNNYWNRKDFANQLYLEIEHNGWENVRNNEFDEDKCVSLSKEFNEVMIDQKDIMNSLIKATPCPSDERANLLNRKNNLTPFELAEYISYNIHKNLGLLQGELNDQAIEIYSNGYGITKIENFNLITGGIPKKDIDSDFILSNTFNKAASYHFQKIAKLAEFGPEMVIDNKNSKAVLDYCCNEDNRFELAQLGIVPPEFGVMDPVSREENIKKELIFTPPADRNKKSFTQKILEKTGVKFTRESEILGAGAREKNRKKELRIDRDSYNLMKYYSDKRTKFRNSPPI